MLYFIVSADVSDRGIEEPDEPAWTQKSNESPFGFTEIAILLPPESGIVFGCSAPS